jgi:hypothetical protein
MSAPRRVEREGDRVPLGGYCEICQRWVWLNPDGSCERGHPPVRVRDIQQLSPMRTAATRTEEPPMMLTRRAHYRWWWRHSLWILGTFTFDFFSWASFFYIGARARRGAWIGAGFLYLLPVIATITSIGTPWLRLALGVQAAAAAGSVLHAFLARPRYRAIMFGDVPRRGLTAPPQPPRLLQTVERPALPAGTDEVVAEIIDQAHDRLQAVLDLSNEIGKQAVRTEVENLCHTGEQILAELGREPRQVELARAFLTYYLEAAQRIVKRYVELGRRESPAQEVCDALERAEQSLESIQRAFDQQLAGLLQSEVIDLDSEIALLEKTVEMDGMGKMRPVGRHTRGRG